MGKQTIKPFLYYEITTIQFLTYTNCAVRVQVLGSALLRSVG